MNERWTLNVEDFGKIEKASVRIAALWGIIIPEKVIY